MMQTGRNRQHPYTVTLARRRRLTENTFELHFSRPPAFEFKPGQKITLAKASIQRDYTLIGTNEDRALSICVRHVSKGQLTPILNRAAVGDRFQITAPFGFFLYQTTGRRAVFVATGTGIAPFVAFVRNGVRDFLLLHGVRSAEQLYYREILSASAQNYLPCISGTTPSCAQSLPACAGRVTDYLENGLAHGVYDFYLCGRGDMIRDATRIIDTQFPDSRIFAETFF
jgi:ferredoxin-NADP reductase